MKEAARTKPQVTGGRLRSEASKMRSTLARYYAARRKLWAEDQPGFYDADLRRIFRDAPVGGGTAAAFMRWKRKAIVAAVVRWTGQRKYVVDALAGRLAQRCAELGLYAPQDEVALATELGAYVAAMVTNHLYTGRFKRSV
jgi:hypothetical protein